MFIQLPGEHSEYIINTNNLKRIQVHKEDLFISFVYSDNDIENYQFGDIGEIDDLLRVLGVKEIISTETRKKRQADMAKAYGNI